MEPSKPTKEKFPRRPPTQEQLSKGRNYVKKYAYWRKMTSWEPKGKSSKIKDQIIADMKACLYYSVGRIRRLKYIITVYQEKVREANKEATRQRVEMNKSFREEKRGMLRDHRREVKALEAQIRSKETVANRHERWRLDAKGRADKYKEERDEARKKVKSLERNLVVVERRLAKRTAINRRPIHRVKVIREEYKPTREEKLLKELASKNLTDRGINVQDILLKTGRFMSKRTYGFPLLMAMCRIHIMGSSTRSDLVTMVSRKIMEYATKNKYINSIRTSTSTTYFLTAKGEKEIKDYMDFLSYTKSELLNDTKINKR